MFKLILRHPSASSCTSARTESSGYEVSPVIENMVMNSRREVLEPLPVSVNVLSGVSPQYNVRRTRSTSNGHSSVQVVIFQQIIVTSIR